MTTYYVGPGGNDANNGSSWALRKLTLNGAEDIPVAAADVVYVGPGTYRETLTVDVSGNAGNPITYIGDYTGANTDGVGGLVRITGSDNDQTAARTHCITATSKNYRTFGGFALDMASSRGIAAISCTNWVLEKSALVGQTSNGSYPVEISGSGQASWTIRSCYIDTDLAGIGVWFNHSGTVSDCGHVVENCVFVGLAPASSGAIRSTRVGGILVRNCTFSHVYDCVIVSHALAEGQVITVNNCIMRSMRNGLVATVLGEIVEDYNTFWVTTAARTNVAVGANSLTYPPLFDLRWFFEAVNGGDMVTPFDLSSYSPLVNVAGTSPTTTDLRGASVIGAQREWGALEYDSALKTEGAASPDYPAEADVRFGVDYDSGGSTGTLDLPAEADVEDGVTYDGATKTGTFDPMAAAVFPLAADVLDSDAAYGPTGAEYAGTYHAPDAAEVIDTAVFGPASGTAGTYDTTGAAATPEEIATAVWAAVRASNDTAGSFGAVSEWASTGGLSAQETADAVNNLAPAGASGAAGSIRAEFAALADDAEIATAVAAAILVTPANKLATGASGEASANVTLWNDEEAGAMPAKPGDAMTIARRV